MNLEIEKAFAQILAPIMEPLQVVKSFSAEVEDNTPARLIVDASSDNESPVSSLWRLPVVFRLDFPALVDEVDQTEEALAAFNQLHAYLKDRAAVAADFTSTALELLPKYHVSVSRLRLEGFRLLAEVEVIAGYREL